MTTKAVLLARKNGDTADVILPYTSADLTEYNNPVVPGIEHVADALDNLFQNGGSGGDNPALTERVDALESEVDAAKSTADTAKTSADAAKTAADKANTAISALQKEPPAHADSHATGGSDALTPEDIGAVPTARSIAAGTGLNGGGNLSANRTFSVKYGTTAGTAAQGDDARLAGGADWTASKPGIVRRVEDLEGGGGVEAGTGLTKSGKTLSVKYGTAAGTALQGNGTAVNSTKWNGAAKTVSAAGPSGGADGDVWFQYV